MNYQDPKLRAMLAGEYVLGTLRGAARRRFERLLADDTVLRAEVDDWQRKLVGMSREIAAVEPPSRVWRAIAKRIAPPQPRRAGWWANLNLWRSLALAGGALSLLLAVLLFYPGSRGFEPTHVAVFHDRQNAPLWLVEFDPTRQQGDIKVLAFPELEPGKSLELWLLPAGDRPPVSLGLIPAQGRRSFTLQPRLWRQAKGLAVSLEPGGGSPTGQPTGPVVYQAPLLPI